MKVCGEHKEREQQREHVASSSISVQLQGKVERVVHIRYQQRSGRKGVTTVEGLSPKLDLKKLATRMKRKWSVGATLKEDTDEGTVMQLQGDLRRQVKVFLVEQGLVKKTHVRLHGD